MNQARTLAAGFALAFLLGSSTATSSLFVVYRSQWGLSAGDIAVVFSSYVCTLLPVLVLCGGFADRFGRRPVIFSGLGFALAGLIVLMFAHDIRWLVAARLLQGVGMGLASGALTAAFVEHYRGPLPAGSAGTAAQSAGLFTGPLLTALAFDLGAGANYAYAPMFVLLAASVLLVRTIVPRAPSSEATADAEVPYAPNVVWRVLLFALPVTFISWTGISLFLSLVPAYIAATLHAHDPLVGAGAIFAVQTASLVATLRSRAIPPERLAMVGPVVMIVGLASLVAGTQADNWILIVFATILVGSGGGVAFAAAIGIAGRAGRGQRARIFARIYVAAYLGFSVPALAIGAIAARSTLAEGFITIIVVLCILTAALPVLRVRESVYAPM